MEDMARQDSLIEVPLNLVTRPSWVTLEPNISATITSKAMVDLFSDDTSLRLMRE